MSKSRSRQRFLLDEFNNDNLHRVAISNLQDHERKVIRWWCNKYKTPQKPLSDHTMEELVVEMIEDYYEKFPQEIERFLASAGAIADWDGTTSAEYEAMIQKRLKKINERNKVDISKYQTAQENLSDEEVERMMASIGRDLPGSRQAKAVASDEFNETFE